MVFLKYNFLFDPAESWAHLSQFESDLADFFAANGMEADIVKSVSGQVGERVLLLKRIAVVSRATQEKPQPDILAQRQAQAPTKDYKAFIQPKQDNSSTPDLVYRKGRPLPRKVSSLPSFGFRKVK